MVKINSENYSFPLTIITINLNNKDGLIKTVKSVVKQTSRATIEYVVIDGDSIDGSRKIIQQHKKDINKYVIEEDNGIYDAMNKGVKLSQGKYCLFLNSGDYLIDNDVISRVLPFLDCSIDIIYCSGFFINNKKKIRVILPQKLSKKYFFNASLMHPSTFIKVDLLKAMNGFDSMYKISGDYDFFLKCYIQNKSFKYYDILVSNFSDGGISTNKEWSKTLGKENKIIRKKYFTKNEILLQLDERDKEIQEFKSVSLNYQIFRIIRLLKKNNID